VAPRSAERHRVCVARVGAPHGVRGEVKLRSFTADPAAVRDYGPLQTDDGRVVEIDAMRPAKDGFVVRLKGIADRDAAALLRNKDLYVPRERLPAPEPDEFYLADLVGLTVVGRDGATLGTVVDLHDFGAGPVLEFGPRQGGDTVMLPFTEEVVPVVDVAGARLVVVPPAETLAEDAPSLPRKRGRQKRG
jgi:16S rRNA processing protein RimM